MKGKRIIKLIILAAIFAVFLVSGLAFAGVKSTMNSKNTPIIVFTKQIKETSKFMETDISIPVITGLKDEKLQQNINSKLEKEAVNFKNETEKYAKEYYEECKKAGFEFRTYQVHSEYRVSYNKNNIISIPVTYYSYTGGAHGITNMVTHNINLKTGSEFILKDMFKEGSNYKDIIKSEIVNQIKSTPDTYFEDAVEVVNEFKDEQSFYIQDGNIVVYYGQYEIAPYASGIREFKIPIDMLKDCMNNNIDIK